MRWVIEKKLISGKMRSCEIALLLFVPCFCHLSSMRNCPCPVVDVLSFSGDTVFSIIFQTITRMRVFLFRTQEDMKDCYHYLSHSHDSDIIILTQFRRGKCLLLFMIFQANHCRLGNSQAEVSLLYRSLGGTFL